MTILLFIVRVILRHLTIRVIVVDRKNERRNSLIDVINGKNGFKVISDHRKGIDALDHVIKLEPDLIVIGDMLHEMSGYAFIMNLMKSKPTAALIIVDEENEVEVDFP